MQVGYHEIEKLWSPHLIFGHLKSGSQFNDEEKKVVIGQNGVGSKATNVWSLEFTVEICDTDSKRFYKQTWRNNMKDVESPTIIENTDKKKSYTKITFKPDFARFSLLDLDLYNYQVLRSRVFDLAGSSLVDAYDPSENNDNKDDDDSGDDKKKNNKKNKENKSKSKNKDVDIDDKDLIKGKGSKKITDDKDDKEIKYDKDIKETKRDKDVKEVKTELNKSLKHLPLTVFWNGLPVEVNNWKKYCALYLDKDTPCKFYSCPRWEICVATSKTGEYEQVSFVNGIRTNIGGTHVDYITNQVTKYISDSFKNKNKNDDEFNIPPRDIKKHLMIFVNCLLINPKFDSQKKEKLTLPRSEFGSSCKLPISLLKAAKVMIKENLAADIKQLELKKLKGMNAKKKRGRINALTKLSEANDAGNSKKTRNCYLMLCEGDSALALVLSSLKSLNPDQWGAFPLKGKFINVRSASVKDVSENEEFKNLMSIVGLEHGKIYKDTKSLRYDHVVLFADQDVDGSHIKGLVINALEYYWPELLEIAGFLMEMVTPIVKVEPKNNNNKSLKTLHFFNDVEYKKWCDSLSKSESNKYTHKYYKGLGTSTPKEGYEYFSNLDKHLKRIIYNKDIDRKLLDIIFGKGAKFLKERKEWIRNHDDTKYVDRSKNYTLLTDLLNNDVRTFSVASNRRAICSMVDGLKPGQRKILHGARRGRMMSKEIKVEHMGSYVSRHCAYHHGPVSLFDTIINLAQSYWSSGNNINILEPIGQFGTRFKMGKDSAAARYLKTKSEIR